VEEPYTPPQEKRYIPSDPVNPVEKYVEDTPPVPVEKTRPGVMILTVVLVIDATIDEESIDTLLGPPTRSVVEQLSAAEYTPNKTMLVESVELKKLFVFPLMRHSPVPMSNVAV
jgi:hypothetical protein